MSVRGNGGGGESLSLAWNREMAWMDAYVEQVGSEWVVWIYISHNRITSWDCINHCHQPPPTATKLYTNGRANPLPRPNSSHFSCNNSCCFYLSFIKHFWVFASELARMGVVCVLLYYICRLLCPFRLTTGNPYSIWIRQTNTSKYTIIITKLSSAL